MSESAEKGQAAIEGYYRLHSRIYDATRWSFLFGRDRAIREAAQHCQPKRILEVGCGTGKNMVTLCETFPQASVTGVDLSGTMLEIARQKMAPYGERVRCLQEPYGPSFQCGEPYDLILFSYALTMFNPGFEEAIAAAHRDLAVGGHVAVVDFHDTSFGVFERWMGVNHVRMNGQLQPLLRQTFTAKVDDVHLAYGGVWRYLLYIGTKA